MKRRYAILLTACVNPGGMPFTALVDTSERLRQYREALDFYLTNTSLPIVFCENTLCDLSRDYQDYISNRRLEYISFDGNNFDKTRGKGYGEAVIMEEALRCSLLLGDCQYIIKITGRLIVKNISQLVNDNSRMFFPTIQTFPSANGMIDSRLIVMPKSFCTDEFLPAKSKINDSAEYYFEHLLFDTLKNRQRFAHIPFLHVPLIAGISGSSGKKYVSDDNSNNNLRFAFDMLGNASKTKGMCAGCRNAWYIRLAVLILRVLLYIRIRLELK